MTDNILTMASRRELPDDPAEQKNQCVVSESLPRKSLRSWARAACKEGARRTRRAGNSDSRRLPSEEMRALCVALVLFIALLPTASATPLRASRRRPSGSTLLSLRPSTLVDKALIDSDRRGADQRQPWVRAVAAVHPVWRTSAALTVTAIVGALIWVQEAVSQGQCTAWQLGTLIVCRALLQLGLLAVAVVALAMLLAVSNRLAALEELKDHGLSNEDAMAAFSCAAYAGERTRHHA